MSWNSVVKKRGIVKDVLVVGVDVGKRMHVAACLLAGGERIVRVKFANDRHGFDLFRQHIETWRKVAGCRDVVIGLESTGHYWECLAYWLAECGIKVVQVNPLHVRRSKETLDNSPGKTDRKDAVLIADLVAQGKYLTLVLPQGIFAELRQLVVLRMRLITEENTNINHVHEFVDRAFPEFSRVFKGVSGKTARYILRHFPFPDQIVALGYAELLRRLKRDCYKGLRKDKVRALWEAAESSVGVKVGREGARECLNEALDRLDDVLEKLERVESKIEDIVERIEESRYMLSVPGIGVMTVATVLSETCGMRDYEGARSVLKLAGLNLYEISSGQRRGCRHISKRGRSLLRWILYFAAIRQARSGSALYDFYRGLVDSGMNKIKALIAVACKLLRLLYALVRDARFYSKRAPCQLSAVCAA